MTECYRDEFVRQCPFCGAVAATNHKLGGVSLYHTVCRRCGSVVRSYVKDPESRSCAGTEKTIDKNKQRRPPALGIVVVFFS